VGPTGQRVKAGAVGGVRSELGRGRLLGHGLRSWAERRRGGRPCVGQNLRGRPKDEKEKEKKKGLSFYFKRM